jgi:hypothetical protein
MSPDWFANFPAARKHVEEMAATALEQNKRFAAPPMPDRRRERSLFPRRCFYDALALLKSCRIAWTRRRRRVFAGTRKRRGRRFYFALPELFNRARGARDTRCCVGNGRSQLKRTFSNRFSSSAGCVESKSGRSIERPLLSEPGWKLRARDPLALNEAPRCA